MYPRNYTITTKFILVMFVALFATLSLFAQNNVSQETM